MAKSFVENSTTNTATTSTTTTCNGEIIPTIRRSSDTNQNADNAIISIKKKADELDDLFDSMQGLFVASMDDESCGELSFSSRPSEELLRRQLSEADKEFPLFEGGDNNNNFNNNNEQHQQDETVIIMNSKEESNDLGSESGSDPGIITEIISFDLPVKEEEEEDEGDKDFSVFRFKTSKKKEVPKNGSFEPKTNIEYNNNNCPSSSTVEERESDTLFILHQKRGILLGSLLVGVIIVVEEVDC